MGVVRRAAQARRADDQLRLEQGLLGGRGAVQQLLDRADEVVRDLLERLAQAGQAGGAEGRRGRVVEAGDRHVAAGSQPALGERAHHPERQGVAGTGDRGGRVGAVEEPVRGSPALVEVVGDLLVEVDPQAQVGAGVVPPGTTVATGVGLLRPADVGDAGVPLGGDMGGGGVQPCPPVDVGPGEVVVAVPGAAEGRERDSQLAERGDTGVAGMGTGQHEGVDRGGAEELAVGRDLAVLAVGLAQDEVAPRGGGRLGERVQELVEQQGGAVVAGGLDPHPDEPGALVAQRACRAVRAVAELLHRRQDLLPRLRRHPAGVVERVGDRLRRDADEAGYVAERHVTVGERSASGGCGHAASSRSVPSAGLRWSRCLAIKSLV
ncbi:hypothetical protein NOZE110980_07230 [Nocardioides zeicaulis]